MDDLMQVRRKIFISHKSVDRDLATRFKDELVRLGFKDDDVFVAEEILPGEELNKEILDALVGSHTMLLLYTDPSHDWDWCLFECGCFAAKRVTAAGDRYQLICLNSGNARLAPLQMWQDVSSQDAFEDLLAKYCAGDAHYVGVNPELVTRRVHRQAAEDLWTAFRQRVPSVPQEWAETLKRRRLLIYITAEAMKEIEQGGGIPPDAEIEVSDGALDIFYRAQGKQRWDQFQGILDDEQKAWAHSLSIVLRMLNSKRTQSPMLPLVRGAVLIDNQVVRYRPAVVQRDELSGASLRFHIEFVRSPEASAVTLNDRADSLYHWLVLARNFREGVLRVYEGRFEEIGTYEGAVALMKQFASEIELVHLEMESRGLNMDHDLKEVFQPAVKLLVEDLERRWKVWLDDLTERMATFARKQGELSGDDRSVLKGAMQTVFHLNELFCAMAAGAYQGMRLTTQEI